MELMRLGEPGQEIPVAVQDGKYFDLRSITVDIDGEFLGGGGIAKARAAVESGLPELEDAASLRIGAPVAKPGAVLCIGQNYAAHAAESGDAPPSVPILFFKHPNTVVGPFDHVVIPPGAEKVDWEVELAVVIGKRASYLASPEEALGYIAGYTVSNDVSERAYQVEHSGGQWSKGKCCATFNPLGPALVPAEEVGDPQKLRLRSSVNGEPRQDSTTADMIFSVAHIVWHLSQYLVLDPGDVINTGTPQGVALSGKFPYLREGDTMEIAIEKLGRQEQKLVSFER
ncbi:fumarylacetoacetate hydrolase family protein [Arthrobacter sp. BB-1]|uniref:fumarylacetoacetate hydrolase family protein n=1 Tax=unclassified Arthrobacter TaxID=235627 RepID=UPI0010DBFD0A|nr:MULTISPECIES: fumarylacetoacetate hydrolase family protein [unclassified Arthrobacter]TNB69850.1 fumarylacetoacetate hydrolase family protein [Arthrobacter sp. BB-1]VII97825.1 2-hydroxyhepta-2,4-diene-1,7-dioate isomerase (EC 5.3.3.-) / 5-carboxymethyl-2-oxo-hex-3-ene-1,7-dioate decarboxylase (EC 4.1.1.68) [Arthrobacter sp. DR-2P]